jgi:hypothetical protein
VTSVVEMWRDRAPLTGARLGGARHGVRPAGAVVTQSAARVKAVQS